MTQMWQGFMCLFCYVSASCKLLHWTKLSLLSAFPKFSYNRLTALSEDGSLYWAFIELSDAGKLHSGRDVTPRKYLRVLVSQCDRWPWYNWVKVRNEDVQDVPCCPSSQVQLSIFLFFLLSWSLSTSLWILHEAAEAKQTSDHSVRPEHMSCQSLYPMQSLLWRCLENLRPAMSVYVCGEPHLMKYW